MATARSPPSVKERNGSTYHFPLSTMDMLEYHARCLDMVPGVVETGTKTEIVPPTSAQPPAANADRRRTCEDSRCGSPRGFRIGVWVKSPEVKS